MVPTPGPASSAAGLLALILATREAQHWSTAAPEGSAERLASWGNQLGEVWHGSRLLVGIFVAGLFVGAFIAAALLRRGRVSVVQVGVSRTTVHHGERVRGLGGRPEQHRRRLGGGILELSDARPTDARLVQ